MYETILEIGYTVIRNGLTWTSALAVLFILLKQRRMKKRLKKVIPWLFQDDHEVKDYVKNQQRIESKLDLLLHERGLSWAGHGEAFKQEEAQSLKKSSFLSQMAKNLKGRVKNMYLRKLASRKFWALVAALAGTIMILFNLDEDMIVKVTAVIGGFGAIVTYIFVEGSNDKANIQKGEQANESTQHIDDSHFVG